MTMVRLRAWAPGRTCCCIGSFALSAVFFTTSAFAQATRCEVATAAIERVYVDLGFPRDKFTTDNTVYAKFAAAPAIQLAQGQSRRWYVDSLQENPNGFLGVLTRSAALQLKVEKTPEWQFTLAGSPMTRTELIGGRNRCVLVSSFLVTRLWHALVSAEPKGAAAAVSFTCRNCALGLKTDFTTQRIPAGETIQMTADFGHDCLATLPISEQDITFSLTDLRLRTPGACQGDYGIANRRPQIPKKGISIQVVRPQ